MSSETEAETPQWVADHTNGALEKLQQLGEFTDTIRLVDVRDAGLRKHSLWFCTPRYEENGAELGYYRLTVQHPEGCTCIVPA